MTAILNKAVLSEAEKAGERYSVFVFLLPTRLIPLHSDGSVEVIVPSKDGTCSLYISNSKSSLDALDHSGESVWCSALIQKGYTVLMHRRTDKGIQTLPVSVGESKGEIEKDLIDMMKELSPVSEKTVIIHSGKDDRLRSSAKIQERSVVDLGSLNSDGVDILYFKGTEMLIEKLLFAGCPTLRVFMTDKNEFERVRARLSDIARRSPFKAEILLSLVEEYSPTASTRAVVMNTRDRGFKRYRDIECLMFDVFYVRGEGPVILIGENVSVNDVPGSKFKVRSFALQYLTSIISELLLGFLSHGRGGGSRYLAKINAKDLTTKVLLKEDTSCQQ